MKKLLSIAMVAALAAGCITVNKNDGGNSSIKPGQVKDNIHLKYQVDKDVVTASDQIHCLFGFICWGSTATHTADDGEFGFSCATVAKNGAYANACDAAKCDQIAGARYKLTTEDYFVYKKCKAEVTGFPVKVVGAEVVDAVKNPEVKPDSSGSLGGFL